MLKVKKNALIGLPLSVDWKNKQYKYSSNNIYFFLAIPAILVQFTL